MDDEEEEVEISEEALGNELLQCARYGEHEELLAILLFEFVVPGSSGQKKGNVDVNFRDPQTGNTALHYAAANGHIECIKVLINHGVKILCNKEGSSPIHWAAQNCQSKALQFIFDSFRGEGGIEVVDVLEKNNAGRSALTDAFQSKDTVTIECCLSHSSASEERLMDTNPQGASAVNIPVNDLFKHAVTHQFQLLSTSHSNTKSNSSGEILDNPILKMRELPITRADNPFGTDAAPEDDSTGLCIWPAAIILSRWVVELYPASSLRGRCVVELGAGCGLPALATAVYCRPELVVVSDIHGPTLANAAFNARLNLPSPVPIDAKDEETDLIYSFQSPPAPLSREQIPSSVFSPLSLNPSERESTTTTTVRCLRLDWTMLDSFPPDLRAHLLLGSDLVYDRKILGILVPAIQRLLAPDGSLLYVAPDTGRDGMVDLTEALARAGIECIERTPAPERYFANPLTGVDEDHFVLHFYDLSAKQPHTLYTFRFKHAVG